MLKLFASGRRATLEQMTLMCDEETRGCSWCHMTKMECMSMDCYVMTRGIGRRVIIEDRTFLRRIFVEMQRMFIMSEWPREAMHGWIGRMPTPSGFLPEEVKTVSDCLWFSGDNLGEDMEVYL